jgi:2-keto-3-deoxy-6-phosphogluconate aldolase
MPVIEGKRGIHESSSQMINQFLAVRVVPVVVLDAAKDAKPLAEACPELLVGAGTLLETNQVARAKDAGATFGLAPGLNPEVAAIGGSWMVDRNLIQAGDWSEITRLTREALAAAR